MVPDWSASASVSITVAASQSRFGRRSYIATLSEVTSPVRRTSPARFNRVMRLWIVLAGRPVALESCGAENRPSTARPISAMTASMCVLPKRLFDTSACSSANCATC